MRRCDNLALDGIFDCFFHANFNWYALCISYFEKSIDMAGFLENGCHIDSAGIETHGATWRCSQESAKGIKCPMNGQRSKIMNNGLIRRSPRNWNDLDLVRGDESRTFGEFVDSLFNGWGSLMSPFDRVSRHGRDFGQTNRIALKQDGKVTGYKYQYALPGFTKEDIDITVGKGVLTVQASKKSGNEPNENEQYEHCGISYSDVQTSYSLPENADIDAVGCTFENGILSITVPLKQAENPEVRKIEVK